MADLPNAASAPQAPLLIDSREAARRLCMSPRRLGQLVASGQIVSVKLGHLRRFRPSDLATFVNRLADKVGGS